MATSGGGHASEAARREAAAWIARMHGPDAEMSRLDFERWRARNPRNRAAYAEMEQLSRLSQRLGETALGRAHLEQRRHPSFLVGPGARIAFATLVVALLAGAAALPLLRGGATAPVIAAGPLATGLGEIRSFRLADGTRVILDTDSAIEQEFTTQARVVRLVRGRARFDVVHDAGRPFMVEAGGRAIIDRGTLFDVALGRKGVRVSLLRGAVEIRNRASPGSDVAPVARLVPGQVFADAPPAGAAQVSAAPGGADQWVRYMLSYDGASLADVVADANRYADRKISLGEPELATVRVTGRFRATPTENLAALLAAALNLRVERTAHGEIVLHKR